MVDIAVIQPSMVVSSETASKTFCGNCSIKMSGGYLKSRSDFLFSGAVARRHGQIWMGHYNDWHTGLS